MKAEELRIGNFITVCNPKDELLEIRTPTIERLNVHHLSDIYFENVDWVYQPIPLTEEWLLKLGFENYDSLMFSIDDLLVVDLEDFTFGINTFDIFWMTNANAIYVHQIQNLYFSLTGKELEIK